MTMTYYAIAAVVLWAAIFALKSVPLTAKLWAWVPDGKRFLVPLVLGAASSIVPIIYRGGSLKEIATAFLAGMGIVGPLAMGIHGGLKESPLPYGGGPGGKP